MHVSILIFMAVSPVDFESKQSPRQVFEIKIIQNSNKTNSNLCLRNMGVERNYNSETVSLREENPKKNIRAHKRKSNMKN